MLLDKVKKIHKTSRFLSKVKDNQYEFKRLANAYLSNVSVEEFMCIESVFAEE